MNQEIIDKISKLLSLATSSNEHESRLAAEKANELLIKYNLTMQDVANKQEEYVTHEQFTGKLPTEHKHVASIIQKHFFVNILYYTRRGTRSTQLKLIGKETNVQIASYVYSFLCNAFKRSWLAYKTSYGVTTRAKQDFYAGLKEGLHKQLSERLSKVQTETGLMVIKDKALDDRVKSLTNGRTRSANFLDINSHHAYNNGVEQGKNMTISRGIESTSTSSNKVLTHNKG